MKNKVKLLSIILFFTALLTFIPRVSHAAQYNSDAEVPINYTIKINKVDSADNKNLKGARFTLKDVNGNVVATQTTDNEGVLSFGNIKTFGSGTDIYYIEEVKTPKGYVLDEKETIEVNVEKTVTNVETGGYKLKITCQTLNYDTDITRYDFVPVSTVDQLKHIGSDAVYVFDGKPYRYTADTNYRLMNDIDLAGENWEPISIPVSGIFDGNGHSIKNLTIASSNNIDYKEVGLFKVYSGIVCNLNMENVNIAIPGYTTLATSISGKGGVGAFAGFMGSGTFKNCNVSGNINSGVDNVGGLVGHSAEKVIIKFQKCHNYADITVQNSRYNVGGLIGCAMCSLSVNDCYNEGSINGNASNVGGLVGHVESKGYEEKAIQAGYAEDGNTITLLIGNSRSEGEYDLYLEDYDLRSLNMLPGGVFTVYDSTLNPIEGFENITLEDGRLRIGTVNIKFEGRDTYFVKDVTPVEGYRKIAGYIKVVVTRYWDFEAEKFRVTVDSKVIDENKIQEEIGNNTNIDLDSISDTFAPDITFENVGWNTAKAVFINCTNNGVINGYRDIAGLVGSAHFAKTTFENCTNNKEVSGNGYGKAAGMVAELYCWGDGVFCEITNCKNYGKISSNTNSTGSSGGMAAQVVSNIKVTNCINEGQIYSTGGSGAGGILCDVTGIIYIDKCKNSGTIETHYNSVNADAGGIVAKNVTKSVYANPIGINGNLTRNQNVLTITNCENTGDIICSSHMGGLLGYTEAGELTISDCKVYSKNANEKLVINDINAGDKGGIAGYVCVPNVKISNCKVENVDLNRTSNKVGDTYGATGGILGNWCSDGNMECNLVSLVIDNSEVTNSNIHTKGQSTAGILGAALDSPASIEISKCKVNACNIHNDYGDGTYGSVAGIFAMSYYIKNVAITDCDVIDSNIAVGSKERLSGTDTNTAGIIALANDINKLTIYNCNVDGTKLENWCRPCAGCATTGGIIAHTSATGSNSALVIDKCTVKGKNKENKTKEDFDIFANDEDCTGIAAVIRNYSNINVSNSSVKDCYLLSNSLDSTSSLMSGMVSYTDTPITMSNCTVDNITLHLDTPTPIGGTNISGFTGCTYAYGECVYNNCDISNSTFISPGSYNSLANITGIAGFTSGKTTFNGCDVYNCKFNATNVAEGAPAAANVAGIIGCSISSQGAVINECTVKECEFSTKARVQANGSNCTLAGMAGVASKISINDSSVENCKLNGGVMCTGGVVGCATDEMELKNVEVKGITIVDRGINSYSSGKALRSIGGVVGRASKLTGTGVTATNVNIDSQALTIGGIVATSSNLNITGSSVSNLIVKNTASDALIPDYGAIAGIAGHVDGALITKCKVNTATLTGDYDTIAGLVGCANGTGTISGCTVTGLTGTNKNTFGGAGTGHSGGLIGISTGATLTIKESEVNSSSLTIGTLEDSPNKSLGGIIGISGNVTLNGCETNSVTLSNGTRGCTGGMVGQVDKGNDYIRTLTAISPKVTGDITISSVNHAGGIVGCGKIVATSPTISGITIAPTGNEASAGGIAGITESDSSVTDADISGITVTAKQHAGGVAGVMYGTITNTTISEITVSSTGSSDIYEAGGIVGVLNGKLSGATIDKANVSSITGDVGGAVGATTGIVENVTITESSVGSPKIIGGVVGAGLSSSTTLINLTVDDATVAVIAAHPTAAYRGKYIGAPSIYEGNEIEPQTAEEETVEEETTEVEEETEGETTLRSNSTLGNVILQNTEENNEEDNNENVESKDIGNEESNEEDNDPNTKSEGISNEEDNNPNNESEGISNEKDNDQNTESEGTHIEESNENSSNNGEIVEGKDAVLEQSEKTNDNETVSKSDASKGNNV